MRGRPKGVKDTNKRKPYPVRANPDAECYLLADSGCAEATLYQKHQSRCLECPFPQCQLEIKQKVDRK